jgi:hypothetical protein
MFETVINLKPERDWRPGMTVEKLINEMDKAVKLPGVSNAWTMPIKARIDMLTTGVQTPIGIKIFGGNGFKLSDEQENTIEDLMLGGKLADFLPPAKDMGQAFRMEDVNGRYVVFLKNTFPRELSMEGLKMVLDTANGATYRVAPEAFIELGADVDVIHNTPNGVNINDKCGSQHTSDLKKKVHTANRRRRRLARNNSRGD